MYTPLTYSDKSSAGACPDVLVVKALLPTVRCNSPVVPCFDRRPGDVRKLTITWEFVAGFVGVGLRRIFRFSAPLIKGGTSHDLDNRNSKFQIGKIVLAIPYQPKQIIETVSRNVNHNPRNVSPTHI